MEVKGSPAGGMLCDEQGLGKTPTTVCLIATRTFERVKVRYNSPSALNPQAAMRLRNLSISVDAGSSQCY